MSKLVAIYRQRFLGMPLISVSPSLALITQQCSDGNRRDPGSFILLQQIGEDRLHGRADTPLSAPSGSSAAETEIVCTVSHPNIARVCSALADNPFVMELVGRISIGFCGQKRITELSSPICLAERTHRASTATSNSNVLVTERDAPLVKVIDCPISQQLTDKRAVTSLTIELPHIAFGPCNSGATRAAWISRLPMAI